MNRSANDFEFVIELFLFTIIECPKYVAQVSGIIINMYHTHDTDMRKRT